MSFDRTQIEAGVREVLEEALGVDAESVKPTSTLTGDLGAESIDFLDIQFRLEKKIFHARKAVQD